MTDKVSVRLGHLTAAVDAEAARERRTRSDTIRLLIEEALEQRESEDHKRTEWPTKETA